MALELDNNRIATLEEPPDSELSLIRDISAIRLEYQLTRLKVTMSSGLSVELEGPVMVGDAKPQMSDLVSTILGDAEEDGAGVFAKHDDGGDEESLRWAHAGHGGPINLREHRAKIKGPKQ